MLKLLKYCSIFNAPIKVLPHLPPSVANEGCNKEIAQNFGPGCGSLDNGFTKGGDSQKS